MARPGTLNETVSGVSRREAERCIHCQAARVYDAEIRKVRGEFAVLNFPEAA